MSSQEIDELRSRLRHVGNGLREARTEWETTGHLRGGDAGTLEEAERRVAHAEGRLDEAARAPGNWSAIRDALHRDVHALSEEFRGLIARSDSAEDRHGRSTPPK